MHHYDTRKDIIQHAAHHHTPRRAASGMRRRAHHDFPRGLWDEAVPYMRAAVRGLLEERLDRINANASRAATYLARAGLRGSEVATMEQLLCA